MTEPAALEVRRALPADVTAAGELTARVYVADGHTPADSPYVAELRAADRRAAQAELLVAVRNGQVLGSVTYAPGGSAWAELAGPGEAEFRMLVVDPRARGTGIGEALLRACIERARASGARALVLSTQPEMAAAHRLYLRLGFTRAPERDWSPYSGVDLLAYELPLDRTG